MSGYSIDAALADLVAQINTVEKDLIGFIEEKKMTADKSMSISNVNKKLQNTPIAIIGMASIFPQARNLREYWKNILSKVDCITDIPDTHWNVEDYYDPNPRTPLDKTYCKKGGFIPKVDFNPMEFGIPPSILEVTDVSQLLSLVIAKEAMEDAGYGDESKFNRENTGVILGSAALKLGVPLSTRLQYPIWKKALRSSGLSEEDTEKIIEKIQSAYVQWNENAFPGMLSNVVSGRIANRLNLGGTNCTVDAACASSLAALKMAIGELVEHRTNMMLTGGVDTDNSINAYVSFSKTPAVSTGDKVKPFDADSDGMMLGEGIGILVLKRLDDAIADNDKIYAVIKGIGTSSDGRYKSIYAPRKEGQVKALRRAYEDAGFLPQSVELVEAHGTGTMAGDPTEFGSLADFFAESDQQKQHVALGSVKSQIGHTKAAAGAASLIKTALALHHKVLPPTINVDTPNPKLNIENSAFYLNTETRPWIKAAGESPRRAGVSSFGFGGTNYHVLLEEYNSEPSDAYRLNDTPGEILLHAETPAKLLAICEEAIASLRSESANKNYIELLQECKSKEVPLESARVGFITTSSEEACKFLKITADWLRDRPSLPSWEHPQGIFYRRSGIELSGKVVALFSGQGSQYIEMGRELATNFPQLRQMHGYMDSLLLKDNLRSLSSVVFPNPVFSETERQQQIDLLQRTEYAQPAIGVLSAGLYKILQQSGFKPDFVAGHSFGELTALWVAGVLSEEDYCFLVKARGQAMAAPKDPNYDTGAMLAVKEDLEKVEVTLKNFPKVSIANLNSPHQVVLAGPTEEIHKVKSALESTGCTVILLPVSAAFHTPLIAFAQKSFAIATKNVSFNTPQIPVYTNVTGQEYPQNSEAIQSNLEGHLSSSVLFKQEIENIYKAGGYCFIEFGPRKILTNLVKDILGDRPHIAVSLNPSTRRDSDRCLRQAFVKLRVIGLPLKNLDPYQSLPSIPNQPEGKKKVLSVPLNGSNYVSEKTKERFTKALQNGHQVEFVNSNQQVSPSIGKVAPKEVSNVNTSPINTASPVSTTKNKSLSQRGSVSEAQESLTQKPLTKAPVNAGSTPQKPSQENKPNLGQSDTLETKLEIKLETSETKQKPPSAKLVSVSPPPANIQNPVQKSVQQSNMQSSTGDKSQNYQQILESLEYVLEQFGQNQSENLQVHGSYLTHQVEYIRTFFQLMQQHNTLLSNPNTAEAEDIKSLLMNTLERSMMQFHNQQGDTLKIHEQYLNHQNEYTKNFFTLLQQQYSQLVTGEIPPQLIQSKDKTTNNGNSIITLDNVSAKKEAPTPDKKVWGIHSPTTGNAANSSVDDSSTNTSSTDNQTTSYKEPVVEKVTSQIIADKVASPPVQEVPQIQEPLEAPAQNVSTQNVSTTVEPPAVTSEAATQTNTSTPIVDIDKNLLAITSEKTGYPVEMLELDMDMEADLGIDSIKRVEIFGALQDLYPGLPQPNLEELSEKRTIGEVVEFLQANASNNTSSSSTNSSNTSTATEISGTLELPTPQASTTEDIAVPTPEEVPETVPVPMVSTPSEVTTSEVTTSEDQNTITNEISGSSLAESLLEITSEKTGYPVEMLELDMDMEADLGIDSIKRVEIFGALQDTYPDLPKPDNMEELGELRTIGEIVEYLQGISGTEKKKPNNQLNEQSQSLNSPVERRRVQLKTLPRPDFIDFSLPEGHIALITDDGSLTTSKLAQHLIEAGWRIVVLSFPSSIIPQQSLLPADVTRFTLADLSEATLQQQLDVITQEFGNIGTFIHLNPVLEVNHNGKVPYLEEEKAIIKQVFFIAKHLKKSLNKAARYGRSCFCTVARLDGAFGLEQQVNFGPIGAGLFGLTKTLNWEWQQMFCRAIDLSPQIDDETSALHILAELHDPNRHITEVAYGTHGRVTLISTP
ncbi:MAG: beta-ketoacyl synthase N-terminal-like domain-containing protein [Cyanobacteria bacterium P01_A01_bin.80]